MNVLTAYGFNPAKASNWTGAEYNAATNSLTNITAEKVTYDYDVGNGKTATYTLIPGKIIIPQNVKATAGDGKVVLTWDEVPGATAYTVKGGSDTTIYARSITANGYTVSGLKNGTTYIFRVFAYVNGKWSAAAVIRATPKA